jgi:hypothetical protein
MAKKAKPSSAGKETASAAIWDRLELIHVRLINLQAELEIKGGQMPDEAHTQTTFGIGPAGDSMLHVNGFLTVLGIPKDAPESGSVMKLNAVYQCVYRITEGTAEDFKPHAEAICATGGLVMYPHMRELVQTITSRMSIIPYILPMYVLPPLTSEQLLAVQEAVELPRKPAKRPAKRKAAK